MLDQVVTVTLSLGFFGECDLIGISIHWVPAASAATTADTVSGAVFMARCGCEAGRVAATWDRIHTARR